MIKSKVGSIKSGWRSVFMIFTAAADDELESIVESAFENVEQGTKSLFLFHLLYLIKHVIITILYYLLFLLVDIWHCPCDFSRRLV